MTMKYKPITLPQWSVKDFAKEWLQVLALFVPFPLEAYVSLVLPSTPQAFTQQIRGRSGLRGCCLLFCNHSVANVTRYGQDMSLSTHQHLIFGTECYVNTQRNCE